MIIAPLRLRRLGGPGWKMDRTFYDVRDAQGREVAAFAKRRWALRFMFLFRWGGREAALEYRDIMTYDGKCLRPVPV